MRALIILIFVVISIIFISSYSSCEYESILNTYNDSIQVIEYIDSPIITIDVDITYNNIVNETIYITI